VQKKRQYCVVEYRWKIDVADEAREAGRGQDKKKGGGRREEGFCAASLTWGNKEIRSRKRRGKAMALRQQYPQRRGHPGKLWRWVPTRKELHKNMRKGGDEMFCLSRVCRFLTSKIF
jgi:hypothetical protein